MALYQGAPYRQQNVEEVANMLRGLESTSSKSGNRDKGRISGKKHTYAVDGSSITVDSWKMQDWDYKKPDLPTYARGLFTTRDTNGKPEIVVRGYDKFFNTGEVRETEWQNIEANTRGPYELSVKENGCIIFMAGLEDGTLIVCSKHSTGARGDVELSHASIGEKWVERHLAYMGRTKQDLANHLRQMNATAVAELCDDEFEEHVLTYNPASAGLYLHGINLNLPEFATYPHDLVNRFAEEWGFKRTTYITKDDIKDVKIFLDHVAETGNFEGRDTEGFVVRCQSKANTGEWHDWFFKYKFEEPYLMYRQWRECTKAVIAGRQPTYRKHKKITAEYIDFAKRQLHGNPQLRKAYNANHGIIKMRDDFLASRGVKGSDIIRQEEQEGSEPANDAITKNIVLVPVATIGCGKTTIALGLCHLFDWGHVQNDNLTVKKGKPLAFASKCIATLESSPAMVADRNNHQRRERKQLIEDISNIVPDVRFVALHYVHDRGSFDSIRQKTRDRVLSRGDNHQTIQAATKGSEEIIGIMEGFLHRFEGVNQEAPPDDRFDLVIDLDISASSRENLETIVNKLYVEYPKLFEKDMPTSDDIDAAIEVALNDYTVDLKHEITGHNGGNSKAKSNRNTGGTAPSKPKEVKIEYFSVQMSHSRVSTVLETMFSYTSADVAQMYRMLKAQRRLQQEFHVTLIHRANAAQHTELWSQLSTLYAEKSAPTPERAYPLPDPTLGTCNVRLERLVWDMRLMAFVVRLSPVGPGAEHFHSVNATAHITVGTASQDIKPKESNDLLARWLAEGSGGNGIQELAVKGNVELEGLVKGVLSR